MAIKFSSNLEASLQMWLNESKRILEEEMSRSFTYLGEEAVKMTRDRDFASSWYDQTGNLRSSIGYSLYSYGIEKMTSNFKKVLKGSDGAKEGKALAQELASRYKNDFALVIVAGMNYASSVENMEGKDVLASTELWAKAKVDDYIKKATEKAIRRIDKLKI